MSHILKNPFLELRFKQTDPVIYSDMFWKRVPLGRGMVTEAVLGQSEVSVGDNDPASSVVICHNITEILRFLALPDSECA